MCGQVTGETNEFPRRWVLHMFVYASAFLGSAGMEAGVAARHVKRFPAVLVLAFLSGEAACEADRAKKEKKKQKEKANMTEMCLITLLEEKVLFSTVRCVSVA